jgi:hypothetical protein
MEAVAVMATMLVVEADPMPIMEMSTMVRV